jgi:hypothetical protein
MKKAAAKKQHTKRSNTKKKRAASGRHMQEEVIMSTEARKLFGFSRDMMTKLLANGTLAYTTDPLDKRIKWVKLSDVEEIAARSNKLQRTDIRTKNASRNIQTKSQDSGGKAAQAKGAARSQTSNIKPRCRPTSQRNGRGKAAPRPPGLAGLHPSDKEMLRHLDRLRREHGRGDNTTPPVGYKNLARACAISERLAQTCANRLILAGAIKRVGHDSGHPDITKRGTIYQVYCALI